ncbi:Gfo/Idh/MocA family protein [Sinanaerobacter chloroacetimidivorans]|uniref:Gfo/Idh/MocA family oxidoreductase n=1 Tax=Sinanaerobacter chloroacetimidivorans TaxID=2818044 RepID=A0A8J7W362_9FIRM|nr:Gfo/Idh/MocA family oxidoreductase [Sinanaerobacter chloroacetimidivorans]MBR0599526.1 Gfo/Idh/MocA family oxidoreductase [Sinanaerobacter chloroacetimidivorans]
MIRIALIGCGRISYKHIQAIIQNKEKLQLVAVCDKFIDRAENRASEYFNETNQIVEIFTEYKHMLDEISCDLISICTESGYHSDIAINCMNKGKHIIVEKPMALSKFDSVRMLETAKFNDVKLCVSHQNRFNPCIQKLREAIEQGRFGRIFAGNARVYWNRGEDYYAQALWRGSYRLDGGCLMNQCIHNIDLLQWMLGGDVDWVHGHVSNFMHPYIEAEDYGSIQIKFNNGAIGNVEGTVCTYNKNLEETLTIIGEKGIVTIGGLAVNKILTWRFQDNGDNEEEKIKVFNEEVESIYGNGHAFLYQDMIEAINNEREPYINGYEGKKAMEIILAAYLSDKEERRVSFPIKDINSEDFTKQREG